MQIMPIPKSYEEMTYSLSLTGLSVLKNGKFKTRHAGAREIVQKPIEGLMHRSDDTLELERIKSLKKPKKKPKPEATTPIVKAKKEGSFTVNKKEVSHRIRNFVNQLKGEKKLYFWTITFPLKTTDDTAFILFNKWLTRLRKEKMLRSYLWISERQKNGTIHFHIAVHQRICVKKANKFMRACIFTSIGNGEIVYSREEAKNYNGVDIAKNRKTRRVTNFAKGKNSKNLINYLTKYVVKNDGQFKHLAWHSSRDYSNLILAVRFTEAEYSRSNLREFITTADPFENDWIFFFKWTNDPPEAFLRYMAMVNNIALDLINKHETK